MKILVSKSLSSNVYQDSLQIRREVFGKEQHVPEDLEIDEYESICTYYVGYLNNNPVATARTFVTADNGWHIQRVAVSKSYRQQGLASKLLAYIEQQAQQQKKRLFDFGGPRSSTRVLS